MEDNFPKNFPPELRNKLVQRHIDSLNTQIEEAKASEDLARIASCMLKMQAELNALEFGLKKLRVISNGNS